MVLYKGYIKTKGKKAIEAFKDKKKYRTYDEVKDLDGFGGVLAEDTILIDIDDTEQSEILMNIVEELQLDCRVYQTSRGRHFLFKNHSITRNRTHVPLAVGLTADIKLGSRSSYEVIKINGEERFCEWDIVDGGEYQEVPKWLFPVRTSADFLDMDAGDGRNQALFNYILTLTANDFSVDETRECIRILNRFVLKEPLSDDELEVILRDEAFQKPVFFLDKTFLFNRFATWLKNNENVVSISNQLHIYRDGIYQVGYKAIEQAMIDQIPNLKKTQRREVLEYMELIAEEKKQADARYIAFRNGVLDIVTGQMQLFSPDLVVTNPIVLIVTLIAGLVVALITLWNTNDGFREAVTNIWNAIKTTVTNVINSIKSVISSVFNAIKSTISSILNSIKSTFTSVWNSIKSTVANVINGVKSTISSGLNAAKSTVSGVLNSIKAVFSNVWNGCKSVVSNAINHIKSIMHFSWSLPHLKLPHISISGSFSLKPPSVPHFGIEWYKKAMDDGMILNQPTIFGYNAKSNRFLAGGEAGSETVVGTQNLMNMIQDAVNNAGSGNGDSEATRALLEAIFNWMRNGGLYKLLIDVLTNGVEFEFDNREIARLVKKYA